MRMTSRRASLAIAAMLAAALALPGCASTSGTSSDAPVEEGVTAHAGKLAPDVARDAEASGVREGSEPTDDSPAADPTSPPDSLVKLTDKQATEARKEARRTWTVELADPHESETVLTDDPKDGDDVAAQLALIGSWLTYLGIDDGFSGLVFDNTSRSVDAYWKGDPPKAVTEFLDGVPTWATVTIHPSARYTRLEMQEAAERFIAWDTDHQYGATSLAPRHDGTGLDVQVSSLAALRRSGDLAVLKTAIDECLDQSARGIAHGSQRRQVPSGTTITEGSTTPTSRDVPTSPYKAGGRYRVMTAGNPCSLGFPVLANGVSYLMSANHCIPDHNHGLRAGYSTSGTVIANASDVTGSETQDYLRIKPTAGQGTTGKVITGAWNSTSTSAVKGWAASSENQPVFLSGASSGQRNAIISQINVPTMLPYTTTWVKMHVVQANPSSGIVVAQGDSGGPVYSTATGGVAARGIISAMEASWVCHSGDTSLAPEIRGNYRCSSTARFVPIRTTLDLFGLALQTS